MHILFGKVTAGGVVSLSEQKHSPMLTGKPNFCLVW